MRKFIIAFLISSTLNSAFAVDDEDWQPYTPPVSKSSTASGGGQVNNTFNNNIAAQDARVPELITLDLLKTQRRLASTQRELEHEKNTSNWLLYFTIGIVVGGAAGYFGSKHLR